MDERERRKMQKSREKQDRKSSFAWKNNSEKWILNYRVEPDRIAKISTRDKLHSLLTTTRTEWTQIHKREVWGLVRQGYNHASCKEVLARLERELITGM